MQFDIIGKRLDPIHIPNLKKHDAAMMFHHEARRIRAPGRFSDELLHACLKIGAGGATCGRLAFPVWPLASAPQAQTLPSDLRART